MDGCTPFIISFDTWYGISGKQANGSWKLPNALSRDVGRYHRAYRACKHTHADIQAVPAMKFGILLEKWLYLLARNRYGTQSCDYDFGGGYKVSARDIVIC